MKAVHMIAFILVIVGGLNWLLTAFNWNVVNMALGGWPVVEKLVYILVGLSAIWLIVMHKKDCKMCGMGGGMSGGMGGNMPMGR